MMPPGRAQHSCPAQYSNDPLLLPGALLSEIVPPALRTSLSCQISFAISSTLNTLPLETTLSSMTRPGVDMTP
jgi:hypothetical protein